MFVQTIKFLDFWSAFPKKIACSLQMACRLGAVGPTIPTLTQPLYSQFHKIYSPSSLDYRVPNNEPKQIFIYKLDKIIANWTVSLMRLIIHDYLFLKTFIFVIDVLHIFPPQIQLLHIFSLNCYTLVQKFVFIAMKQVGLVSIISKSTQKTSTIDRGKFVFN